MGSNRRTSLRGTASDLQLRSEAAAVKTQPPLRPPTDPAFKECIVAAPPTAVEILARIADRRRRRRRRRTGRCPGERDDCQVEACHLAQIFGSRHRILGSWSISSTMESTQSSARRPSRLTYKEASGMAATLSMLEDIGALHAALKISTENDKDQLL